MEYSETLEYLYSTLPMFHRIGPAAYNRNLDKTLALLAHLDHPQNSFKSVHIAGTNGKGSVSSALAAVLQTAGYKTGLYTSPHLIDFTERIRINGVCIEKHFVSVWVEKMKPVLAEIQPSFFETTVALCFDYFRAQGVEVAIIETGLGGRLDSTNVILPELSIITNISWDHADLLGQTLQEIAGEKAGIIKNGTPCVIGTEDAEVLPVFENKAKEVGTRLILSGGHWKCTNYTEAGALTELQFLSLDTREVHTFYCDLAGFYQQENLATVLTALQELVQKGFRIEREDVRQAFQRIRSLTGLRGRMERLGTSPLIYADTGHNIAGISYVFRQLSTFPHKRLHIVWGMVNDKDRNKIWPVLPRNACWYFVKPDLPRGLDAIVLKEEAALQGLSGEAYASVWDGYQAALQNADQEDLVFIGGSTFVVGELLGFLEKE